MRRSFVTLAILSAACGETPTGRGAPAYMPGASDDGDEGDDDGSATLDVDPIDTSGVFPEEGDGEGGDEGFACDPEEVQECPCPDGPGTGIQACEDGLWGPCVCDDAGTSEGGDSTPVDTGEVEEGGEAESTGEPPPPPPTEVCYPGANGQYDTCLDVHAFDPDAPPDGYAYPQAIGGDPNYRRPIAYIDLDAEDPNLALAPNFTLGEFAQAYKGRWGIVQPHAVEAVQGLRDALGPLVVNSGYRSPDYNASIGGAGSSRHMYGDGFDLDPVNVTIDALENACTGAGGMLVEYETHVHCDWRFDDVDEAFFGNADQAAPASPAFAGELHNEGPAFWTTIEGFDEGTPMRRWTAWDHTGRELASGRGPMFVAPRGTAKVTVRIGLAIERTAFGAW